MKESGPPHTGGPLSSIPPNRISAELTKVVPSGSALRGSATGPLSVVAPTVTPMATLPNPLPQLAADPSGRALGLEIPLPQGRLIDTTDDGPWHEPLLWCADEAATPGVWTAVQPARRTAGLLPVLLDVGGRQGGPEGWELLPGEMSYPGDHDADESSLPVSTMRRTSLPSAFIE